MLSGAKKKRTTCWMCIRRSLSHWLAWLISKLKIEKLKVRVVVHIKLTWKSLIFSHPTVLHNNIFYFIFVVVAYKCNIVQARLGHMLAHRCSCHDKGHTMGKVVLARLCLCLLNIKMMLL